MKRKPLRYLIALVTIELCCSWGFFAHKRINRVAVYTLPKAMSNFYRANIDFITAHAVDADKRRYIDSFEVPRHFFDADHFGKKPFDKMPQRWAEADREYSADTLNKYGILPWAIQRYYYKLVQAFKDKDTLAILKTSANLGHYIADAFVPLHLTENYNGQFSNQIGIHALWETRLPELFAGHYQYNVAKARYIYSPMAEAWAICRKTFRRVDSVLVLEQNLSKKFDPEKKFGVVRRNGKKTTDYTEAYAAAYQKALHGMVERQMRSAILEVGSFWFSAWVDAGQPDLSKLTDKKLLAATKNQTAIEQALYKQGHMFQSQIK